MRLTNRIETADSAADTPAAAVVVVDTVIVKHVQCIAPLVQVVVMRRRSHFNLATTDPFTVAIVTSPRVLVARTSAATGSMRSASAQELAPYRFRGDPIQAQRPALQRYLDEIAAELKRDGLVVHRLPLLSVPASLVAWDDIPEGFEFLLTWNNVVLENRRAEGFASLLKSADEAAQVEMQVAVLHP